MLNKKLLDVSDWEKLPGKRGLSAGETGSLIRGLWNSAGGENYFSAR